MHNIQADIKIHTRIKIFAQNVCDTFKMNNYPSAEEEHLFYYRLTRQFHRCVNILGHT